MDNTTILIATSGLIRDFWVEEKQRAIASDPEKSFYLCIRQTRYSEGKDPSVKTVSLSMAEAAVIYDAIRPYFDRIGQNG